ncbi:hypothetical protein [Kaistella antarctica]|uniref:Uncharacterized protein n=1 Tax=Kaistella antarctica TaxID=266748 RepID=A0A3S4YK40_9FLAO|nr:hypothetical protein [Kaistella antarctica]KEY18710.1 hypothetical protein HY04_09525 [Kaistella antarctica]SEW16344.1 hypothetical protein SAMN05421765_2828 [Kaistella antarctica]VEH99675.1 Uncharacterised protein [Kaistella antarctica]
MTIILIFLLIFILIPTVLFFIFVKKFNGIKTVSIILLATVTISIGCLYIFKKSDAEVIIEKLNESKLPLISNYKINKSVTEENWDYYYEYELKISNIDKEKIINEISKAKKFQKLKENQFDDYIKNEYLKEIINNQIQQNYNIDDLYIRKISFPNSSREFEITIDSRTNELKILDHYF